MPSDDFPTAPDAGREFFNNRIEPAREQTAKPTPQPIRRDLDHLEPTLDYTPGGRLEQDVNTQLSDSVRREYKGRMERPEPSREKDYLNQVQERFDKQVEQDRQEHEAKEAREEAAAQRAEQKESREKANRQEKEAGEQKERSAPSYDMPERGDDTSAPASPPPTTDAVRSRPGRLGRDGPDRSGGGHEH